MLWVSGKSNLRQCINQFTPLSPNDKHCVLLRCNSYINSVCHFTHKCHRWNIWSPRKQVLAYENKKNLMIKSELRWKLSDQTWANIRCSSSSQHKAHSVSGSIEEAEITSEDHRAIAPASQTVSQRLFPHSSWRHWWKSGRDPAVDCNTLHIHREPAVRNTSHCLC